MPAPRRVWMFHQFTHTRTGVPGRLMLDEDSLRFQPDSGGSELAVELSRVREVRKVWARPILQLTLTSESMPDVLFYFVQPAYLFGKRAQMDLAVADESVAEDVAMWAAAIEDAALGTGM